MSAGEVSVECRIQNLDGSPGTASATTLNEQAPPNPIKPPLKKSAKDFRFGKVIGEGSFSMVYLAKDIHSNKEYAIKVCEKTHILREKKQKAVMREKQIMNILNNHPSPFFIKLYCTFQDADRLYFVMNYAKHGELLPYIVKVGSFDEECTKFYTAELVLAIEHLHKLNIIHRDLKPENILLDENMHIQITDFGSAKVISTENSDSSSSENTRSNSFVGTAQYVSPEMLSDKSASPSVDLWALGCIVYQMVSGLPPFRAPNEYLIFQKITKLEYDFPDGFLPPAKDLVEKLLVLEPSQRIGSNDTNGYPSIRNHPFLCDIPWENLHERNPPRILPYLPGTSSNEELRSQYQVPDNIVPGLDDKQMTRLFGLQLDEETVEAAARPVQRPSILDISPEEMTKRLEEQEKHNEYHKFVQGNLILKQGIVEKRKGLFARRRMLLLTTGPHLYYVDPASFVLKGEIPWSPELRPESKNFKIFFVHTPNRTYYLIDPHKSAPQWVEAIEDMRRAIYAQGS
ncbi:3-phosphoinositide-dependent protein kinase 1 isoform X1 [Parasteatoda tepidariorum]|uniref:3-phosphoinositide-dependent protein kinase 1 isoform X1 n=1 Tax=Parasteatoda tepidariorum TaxID=114398 RepID=UPI00077F884B|nr:3-phosphoinositide-dependent protein kinase 1 isoform X2 [Parasteatoda tepidariorum]